MLKHSKFKFVTLLLVLLVSSSVFANPNLSSPIGCPQFLLELSHADSVSNISIEEAKLIVKNAVVPGINRYSFYRDANHGAMMPSDYLDFCEANGIVHVQIHVNSFDGMNSKEIETVAQQALRFGISVELDISSVQLDEIPRVRKITTAFKNIHPIKRLRTYIRGFGSIEQIIQNAIIQLNEIKRAANRLGLELILEQHEVLTGPQIVRIVEEVNRAVPEGSLGVLFDFANPITARRDPIEDLKVLLPYIRAAHIKNAFILPTVDGGFHQYGIDLSAGDLNYRKMITMLLSRPGRPVDLFLQSVVGYHAFAAVRNDTDASTTSFEKRGVSITYVAPEIIADPEILSSEIERERQIAEYEYKLLRWTIFDIRSQAHMVLGEREEINSYTRPEVLESWEAKIAKQTEAIGEKLFGNKDKKKVWYVNDREQWQAETSKQASAETLQLLQEANELKKKLSPPLFNETIGD